MIGKLQRGVPIPNRQARGARTSLAAEMLPGDSRDVATLPDAVGLAQAITGWGKNKTKRKGRQMKLLHDGVEITTDVCSVGEYFWRVWRVK